MYKAVLQSIRTGKKPFQTGHNGLSEAEMITTVNIQWALGYTMGSRITRIYNGLSDKPNIQ